MFSSVVRANWKRANRVPCMVRGAYARTVRIVFRTHAACFERTDGMRRFANPRGSGFSREGRFNVSSCRQV
jgi:hypothetical protein